MINQIQQNFGQNELFAKVNKFQASTQSVVKPETPADKFESSKKKDVLKYSAIGIGVVALVVAIIKHKSIKAFLSKIFNKGKSEPILPDPNRPHSGGTAHGAPGGSDGPINPPKNPNGVIPSKSLLNIEEYNELNTKWEKMLDSHPEKQALGKKLYQMEKQMKEENISFVEKPKFTCGDENPEQFAKEKLEYLKKAMNLSDNNEASALDALKVFEDYGKRYEYGIGNCFDTLSDLTVAVSGQPTDKVLSRYIDVFEKHARIDGDYTDTRHLSWLIKDHNSKMSKDTIIKYIESLKKFSFERSQADTVRRNVITDEFTNKTPEELSEIDKHLKELEEIVKDMPYKNKEKPNS